MNFSHDDKLNEIAERTIAGERLSFEDGVALYATEDPPSVNSPTRFAAAGTAITYFNVNRHLNQRRISVTPCKFCGFFRTPRQPDAYTHNMTTV